MVIPPTGLDPVSAVWLVQSASFPFEPLMLSELVALATGSSAPVEPPEPSCTR